MIGSVVLLKISFVVQYGDEKCDRRLDNKFSWLVTGKKHENWIN